MSGISGTDFTFQPSSFVPRVCLDYCPSLVTRSEIDEIRAECEAERAFCLACRDGMVVIDLRPKGENLELFIWIAVAWRYGAVERQLPGIERIARDLGARTLAFQTRRRGWAKRLGSQWHPRGTDEFVKDLAV